VKKFLKGMHKDAERVDMPEGTYRDALNANFYYTKGAVVNEQGNKLIGDYSSPNYPIISIIGQCALEDGRIVIFGIDDNRDLNGNNIIALATPKQNRYEVLYRNNALNFQEDYTIEATAKIDSKNQIKVYFTDNYISKVVEPNTGIEYIDEYNPPRVFDVTAQLNYISSIQNPTTFDQIILYTTEESYTVDKLDLFLHSGFIPEFTTVNIVEGGGVVSGTYHLALAYMDDDRNTTNYLVTSNAVHIVTAHEDSIPTESIAGDPQGSQSNKSITWNFTIPEDARNYTFLQPVVIQRFGGGQNQESSEFAYALDPVKINSDTDQQSVTYTGLETVAQSSVSEVILDSVRYETAKTIVQLDNKLYLSNLQARGDIGFQRFANSITLRAVTEEIKRFDPRHFDVLNINKGYTNLLSDATAPDFKLRDTIKSTYKPVQTTEHEDLSPEQQNKFSGQTRKGYKDINLSYNKKSFRRSEVYAFYISFVLLDGTETYAYHIPGRPPLTIGDTGYLENESLRDHSPSDFEDNVGFNTSEVEELYENSSLHQFTDTQVILKEIAGVNVSTSYWENANEFYPNTDDFTVWETTDGGTPTQVGDLQGEKVRHHKMPSNKHSDYSFITGIESWDNANSNVINQFTPNLFGENNENQTLELAENIRLLGVQLDNIHIPKFILRQVQGYKIYYAKRNQKDKTIIGQSVPVPSALRANTVLGMYTAAAKFGPYHRAWWMYGGIPPNMNYYPKIASKFYDNSGALYRGFSVFKLHDFNLLKNKHSLSGVSHIDVQSILTFRYYAGGPGAKDRPYPPGYKTFPGTEWGPNSEIGNTSYPNDPDNIASTAIRAWATSVFLAAGYHEPKTVTYSEQFYLQNPVEANKLNNVQTVYTIQPKSITYLPGATHLESTDSGAYHGARYLLNFAGESAIAVGLSTGLPTLVGFLLNPNFNSPVDIDNSGRFWWYPNNGWLNPAQGLDSNLNWVLNLNSPYIDNTTTSGVGGHPTTYLINLCSIKENVYDSFDEQQLVWTGYYKSLKNVDKESGYDPEDNKYYFEGTTSDEIFGGDTYITRYGFRSTVLSYGHHNWLGSNAISDIPFDLSTGMTGNTMVWPPALDADVVLSTDAADSDLGDPYRWTIGNNTPIATIFYFFCESDDLIGYRHSSDSGVLEKDGRFFDGSTASSVLFKSPASDGTHIDNLLYMNNYSLNQDLRVAIPLPKKLDDIKFYPTRVIRSNLDEGVINDMYRKYLTLEFKDLPKNRGDVWDLFTFSAVLYIHTEKSIFVTKGKQNLQLADASQAFIGSGDIFAQTPDELIPSNEGFGGTDAQFASITTRFGHFFVNRDSRKVFLFTQQLLEISAAGMEKWFNDNLPFVLEDFGVDLSADPNVRLDAPTSSFGFTSAYDPKFKRIILTKRELVPTAAFLSLFNQGNIEVINNQFYNNKTGQFIGYNNQFAFKQKGWTISYYPELKIWGSRHSYNPRLYSYTPSEYYSLVNFADVESGQIWEHSDYTNPGNFYGVVNNFEFEYIDNSNPGQSKIFTNIYYWSEIQSDNLVNISQNNKYTSPGFTSFYVYNTQQISGEPTDILYLTNTRLADKIWHINDFRDRSLVEPLTADLITNAPNVQEDFTTSVSAPTQTLSMFTEEGVVNANYIDINKQWYEQRKFVDHYLGVRLICNNSTKNLIHLYAAGTKFRKSFR